MAPIWWNGSYRLFRKQFPSCFFYGKIVNVVIIFFSYIKCIFFVGKDFKSTDLQSSTMNNFVVKIGLNSLMFGQCSGGVYALRPPALRLCPTTEPVPYEQHRILIRLNQIRAGRVQTALEIRSPRRRLDLQVGKCHKVKIITSPAGGSLRISCWLASVHSVACS